MGVLISVVSQLLFWMWHQYYIAERASRIQPTKASICGQLSSSSEEELFKSWLCAVIEGGMIYFLFLKMELLKVFEKELSEFYTAFSCRQQSNKE
jgi:hypothetical protein